MGLMTVLDEYKRTKHKQLEDYRQRTIQRVHRALNELRKHILFDEAYIFGSILSPSFSEDSDIDIAFTGLRDEDFFKAMAFLSAFLEREVDIVQLEDHRLKDTIIKNGIKWKIDK